MFHPAMQAKLEFHDSEVRSIDTHADTLRLAFSAAYVHLDSVRAGYVQSLEMQFRGAAWDGPVADCVGRLSAGRLLLDGSAQSSIPLPYSSSGTLRVELQFSNGAHLHISAAALVCRFTGDPTFVESFAC